MKQLIIKTTIFLSAFACIAPVYDYFYLPHSINIYLPELNELDGILENQTDALLLGSSVNKHVNELDTDSRSISQMMNDLAPNCQIAGLSHPAYQMDIFETYLGYISKDSPTPLMIIPINLRSISPTWDLRPTFRFHFEKQLIKKSHLFLRFYSRNKDRTGEVEYFKSYPIYFDDDQIGVIADFETPYTYLEELDKSFIARYMQPIQEDNQKMIALENVLKLCKKRNVKAIFYFTPIDYTKANYFQIEGFEEQVSENIKQIKAVLAEHEVEAFDLTYALDSTYFSYSFLPNEHLNQKGRMYLATFLSEKVEENLAKK